MASKRRAGRRRRCASGTPSRDALKESPTLAALTSSLLEGIDSLLGVLDAQAGTYTLTKNTIKFEDPARRGDITALRAADHGHGGFGEGRPAAAMQPGPMSYLLQAIGTTRLPWRPDGRGRAPPTDCIRAAPRRPLHHRPLRQRLLTRGRASALERLQRRHADPPRSVVVGPDDVHQSLRHHRPRERVRPGTVIAVVPAEASRIHLQQRAQLPPAMHHVERARARPDSDSARGGRSRSAAGVERGLDHLRVRARAARSRTPPAWRWSRPGRCPSARRPAAWRPRRAPRSPGPGRGPAGRPRRAAASARRSKARRCSVELAADRRVRGEMRHEQVRRRHQGADPFGVELAQRLERLRPPSRRRRPRRGRGGCGGRRTGAGETRCHGGRGRGNGSRPDGLVRRQRSGRRSEARGSAQPPPIPLNLPTPPTGAPCPPPAAPMASGNPSSGG